MADRLLVCVPVIGIMMMMVVVVVDCQSIILSNMSDIVLSKHAGI